MVRTIIVSSYDERDIDNIINDCTDHSYAVDNWFETNLSYEQISKIINFSRELASANDFDSSWARDRFRSILNDNCPVS